MFFSSQSAGLIAAKVSPSKLNLPTDPSYANMTTGTVVSGGISLGAGLYRRTSSVMIVEVPVSGATRLRFLSQEDASARIGVVSMVARAVQSAACTANTLGTLSQARSNTRVPFVAANTLVMTPCVLTHGSGDVISGLPMLSSTPVDSSNTVSHVQAGNVQNGSTLHTSTYPCCHAGNFVGFAISQGGLKAALSDVATLSANISAMAMQGTPIYVWQISGGASSAWSGPYYGDSYYQSDHSTRYLSVSAITKLAPIRTFSHLTASPGTVWVVVEGDASGDLVNIQKGI